ncbi:MAG: 4Fe-4S dicluster domain-containing protein [Hungateiclostridium thermocellum]|nr:4Fe-4S dicluster domain-containing protein [Acetivibrio thermocellus]
MKPIINKKSVRKNQAIKKIVKQGKKVYQKGSKKVLKSYIGKVVQINSMELLGTENRVNKPLNKEQVTREYFLKKLEASGLIGMGGGCFPVIEKINTFLSSDAENRKIIINAVECEPGLKQDEWLLYNRKDEIMTGIGYIQNALKVTDVTIAVSQKLNWENEEFKICQVPARFPIGEEHFLINAVTGDHMEMDIIPAEEGILVMNLQTVYQIYRLMNCAYDGRHFVTIANMKNGEARVALVSGDDKVIDTVKKAFSGEMDYYCGSGVLTSRKATPEDVFTSQISFAAISPEHNIGNENKCKGCGKCTKKCPSGVQVHEIVKILEEDKNADISMYYTDKCIQCGCCAYFCMAGKIPYQYFNWQIYERSMNP